MMFTIKICGITRPDDARVVAAAGADAIGLNFYPQSPRAIDPGRAKEILAALPLGIAKVGLFVNAVAPLVCETFDWLGLDLIQLHGDEPPEYVAELRGRPVMKAFRSGIADGLHSIMAYLDACRTLSCLPRMVLLDAPAIGSFGGSGKLADWWLAKQYQASCLSPMLVLAGGLKPENVADAIRATGVQAVDTASGVESQPGIKDRAAVDALVRSARSEWRKCAIK
jgi:phosphoribosylanthranilate isomerase